MRWLRRAWSRWRYRNAPGGIGVVDLSQIILTLDDDYFTASLEEWLTPPGNPDPKIILIEDALVPREPEEDVRHYTGPPLNYHEVTDGS